MSFVRGRQALEAKASIAGEPEQIHSAFVVGLKKLPIRYRIQPAA